MVQMSFFEGSARVPLMIAAPGWSPRGVEAPVSTLDVLPTLCQLAQAPLGAGAAWLDGESLVPLAHGEGGRSAVAMEYAAEGSVAPMVALREGKWKAVWAPPDPPQLYDLHADPRELENLALHPLHADVWADFERRLRRALDLAAYDRAVRASQHVATSPMRRCARARTRHGTSSHTNLPRAATCATTWTSTCSNPSGATRAANDARATRRALTDQPTATLALMETHDSFIRARGLAMRRTAALRRP